MDAASCYSGLCAATGPLAQAEDNELGGLHGRKANVDEQLAAVAHIRRIQLLVAFHEEGFLRCPAKEHAIAPRARQERLDVTLDARPQIGIIWLEDNPLRAAFDG